MKPLLYVLLSFMSLSLVAAQSDQSTQSTPPVSAGKPATTLGSESTGVSSESFLEMPPAVEESKLVRVNWRKNIETTVPASICADETWHRQCFNVRESQCLSATSEVMDQCIDYVTAQNGQGEQNPSQVFDQTRVCAITLYERRFARRFKFVQQCTDRSRW